MVAPLIGVVAYARRQALRLEWRSHIEALVEGYLELGTDPDEAVAQALKQFGNPRRIGRQWANVWDGRTPDSDPHAVGLPMLAALASFGLASVGAGILRQETTLFIATAPVWAGLIAGLATRGRHMMGTFYALALLIPFTLWSEFVLPWHWNATAGFRHTYSALAPMPLAVMQFLLWMPLGCATSALGGWLRRHLEGPGPTCVWD
jgi:hypothetical protein